MIKIKPYTKDTHLGLATQHLHASPPIPHIGGGGVNTDGVLPPTSPLYHYLHRHPYARTGPR